jgi:cytochrome c-type biogenesis protein CcmE
MAAAKPRRQRLVLALSALGALVAAGLIATFALQDTAAYFRVPSDLATNRPVPGEAFRLGGLVKKGSVSRSAVGLVLHFTVTDMKAETPASYRGIVPDLFRENQGVIATGSLDAGGRFVAQELLAKHDENYVPRELEGMSEHQAAKVAEDTTVGLK